MRILRKLLPVVVLLAVVVAAWLSFRPSLDLSERWEREAGRPLEEFVQLMAVGRAGPACDRLSPRLQRDLRDIAGMDGDPHWGCMLAVGLMANAHTDEELDALREARANRISMDGDRAQIRLDNVVAPGGVKPFDGGVAHLVVGPDGWLVDRIK